MVDAASTLAQVSEGDVLARIFPFFGSGPQLEVGPGDDAAVLRTGPHTVLTTDSMIRSRDWLDAWSGPADVAAKLLTQNLADVAAMGAVPTAVVVTLLADPQTPLAWVVELARALGELATTHGVVVAGGDLSSAPEGVLAVSLTATGDLGSGSAVLRSGARPGDTVAVRGTLGRSAAGLLLLQDGADPADAARKDGDGDLSAQCLAHHLRPSAPLAAGPQAAEAGATSMIDLSDGLLRDATRVADASGVRVALGGAAVASEVEALRPVVGRDRARECVLAGGEEHSLLATFPGEVPTGWRVIGQVETGQGVTVNGRPEQPRGWDHFAHQP